MKENTLSYANEYLYVLFHERSGESSGEIFYCAGTNLRRFHPITHGRHARAMNPAFRGLQLLRFRTLVPAVLKRGGRAIQVRGSAGCDAVTPSGDGWFRESLLVSGLSFRDFEDLLQPCVRSLARFVLESCFPGLVLPRDLSDPATFEAFLDSLA